MNFDIFDPTYLESGSDRQKRAYTALKALGAFEKLSEDAPVALVGSLPLDLALDESDINLTTSAGSLRDASQRDRALFGAFERFHSERGIYVGEQSLLTTFLFSGERFSIVTQLAPVPSQSSVLSLLGQARLLDMMGLSFRERVRGERQRGAKTIDAFAQCLNLSDPVRDLSSLDSLSDSEVRDRFRAYF